MWFIDDILDSIFNFALGGMIDICFDKNTAMPIRVLTGIILIAAYIALIGFTIWGCYKLVSDGETGFAVLLGVLAFIYIAAVTVEGIKRIKEKI